MRELSDKNKETSENTQRGVEGRSLKELSAPSGRRVENHPTHCHLPLCFPDAETEMLKPPSGGSGSPKENEVRTHALPLGSYSHLRGATAKRLSSTDLCSN